MFFDPRVYYWNVYIDVFNLIAYLNKALPRTSESQRSHRVGGYDRPAAARGGPRLASAETERLDMKLNGYDNRVCTCNELLKIMVIDENEARLRVRYPLNCEKRRNYKFDIAAVGCDGSYSNTFPSILYICPEDGLNMDASMYFTK
ncbi:hypothetical protein EVAR_47362_1 [Eumeta japonica]|uniref:Uncharacterized protein n=1 Tax=Eumeta variegata TaxID=151549 RepID=A0A4C1WT83_EUMVA|nr:hypothetical protein EVAR_47362_1 [Eumeta japonica]